MIRFASTQQAFWDWRAACNFMFGGTGSSLMLVAALASTPAAAAPSAMLLALLLIGAGLSCVWLEIGRPWRAMNVYRHARTSWMTRESIAAVGALGLGAAAAASSLAALSLAAGLAGALFLYCQGRLLRASRGIPAWREPSIVGLIVLTGLAEGMGLLLALSAVSGAVPAWQPLALLAAVAARGFAAQRYRLALQGARAPAAALAQLDRQRAVLAWLGHAAPVLLALIALLPLPAPFAAAAALSGGLAALAGGWWMKFVIVTRAAHVQGYAFGRLHRGHPLT